MINYWTYNWKIKVVSLDLSDKWEMIGNEYSLITNYMCIEGRLQ